MAIQSKFDYKTHYNTVFQRFIKENHCPLLDFRKRAFEHFEQHGFPNKRVEDWRFTSCYEIAEKPFLCPKDSTTLTKKEIEPFLFENIDTIQLVLINGHYRPELSTQIDEQNISISSISKLCEAHDTRLEKIGTLVSAEENVFAALNASFFRDGFFIEVKQNAKIDKPIHIINIDADKDENSHNAVRHFISVAKNAELKIVESYHSHNSAPDALINVACELEVADGANVEYISIQQADETHHCFTNINANVAENGQLITNLLDFGSKLVRHTQNIVLDGANAHAKSCGTYIGHQRRQIDHYLYMDHAVGECSSEQLFRGVLTDKAKAVFRGRVVVRPDSQNTDASQSSKALLLSDDAQSHNLPQLEIYADDVRCSHGATVGELDKSSLFYLQSRGISEERAKQILTVAFAEEVVDHITIEPVRQKVYALIDQNLSKDLS